MAITACGDEYTEEDKEALHEAEKGYDSTITQEVWGEFFEQHMPEVERAMEEFDKELNTTIKEIEIEFKEIIEKDFTVEFEPPQEHNDRWQPDEFEKEGFGPIVRELPEPEGLLGDIKTEKIFEVKDEVKVEEGKIIVERILGEEDLARGFAKEYEPRKESEIKEKVSQLQEALEANFKDKVTPEERAIIKELKVPKDAEKIQRDWIEKGMHIHKMAHYIKDRLSTPDREARLEQYYQECKEKGKFVSHRAQKDRDEFYCENLRVFCTQEGEDRVKECHPGMYHLIEIDFKFLETWKEVEVYKEK